MVKAVRNASNTTQNGPRETPSAFLTGAELVAAAPFVAEMLATHGPAVGRALLNAFKREDPTFLQLRASWKGDDGYFVVVNFRNLTEHGLYLEDMWSKKPKDTPLLVCATTDDQPTVSFGKKALNWAPPNKLFPKLVDAASTKGLTLILKLSDFKSERGELVLSQTAQIEIGYKISRLDQKESKDDLSFKVLIRQAPQGDA